MESQAERKDGDSPGEIFYFLCSYVKSFVREYGEPCLAFISSTDVGLE